jgi:transcription elongation factor GreA
MNRTPMTLQGQQQLTEELKHLKSVARPRIVAAIAQAREHGDLKENAEYHAAKEQQAFAEGRIAEIEAKLSLAQVIDLAKLPQTGKIVFGTTVDICDAETGETKTYQLVGDDEANIEKGKISFKAPIARALIGKQAGDVIEFKAPAGLMEYEIMAVRYC